MVCWCLREVKTRLCCETVKRTYLGLQRWIRQVYSPSPLQWRLTRTAVDPMSSLLLICRTTASHLVLSPFHLHHHHPLLPPLCQIWASWLHVSQRSLRPHLHNVYSSLDRHVNLLLLMLKTHLKKKRKKKKGVKTTNTQLQFSQILFRKFTAKVMHLLISKGSFFVLKLTDFSVFLSFFFLIKRWHLNCLETFYYAFIYFCYF